MMINNVFLGKPNLKIIDFIDKKPILPKELCFTANEVEADVSLIVADGSESWCHLQYSTDNTLTWQNYNGTIVYPDSSTESGYVIKLDKCKNSKVYFRADPENPNDIFYNTNTQYHKFVINGSVAASGSIQYLLTADGNRLDVPSYCYKKMFYGCTTLTQAPTLPATTINDNCYYGMFFNCTALTQAPILPATVLKARCYTLMFYNCKNIASITVKFIEWDPTNATTGWMSDAGSTVEGEKTFICPTDLPEPTTRGASTIPVGWNIIRK